MLRSILGARGFRSWYSLLFLGLALSCSEPPRDPDAEQFRLHWMQKRQEYCQQERGEGARQAPFDASLWREGSEAARGAMLHDLICGSSAYGRTRAAAVGLLGPGDEVDARTLWDDAGEPLMYRVGLSDYGRIVPPPPPPGCSTIPDMYDVRVVFDMSDETVIGFDPLPALDCPGAFRGKARESNP